MTLKRIMKTKTFIIIFALVGMILPIFNLEMNVKAESAVIN